MFHDIRRQVPCTISETDDMDLMRVSSEFLYPVVEKSKQRIIAVDCLSTEQEINLTSNGLQFRYRNGTDRFFENTFPINTLEKIEIFPGPPQKFNIFTFHRLKKSSSRFIVQRRSVLSA